MTTILRHVLPRPHRLHYNVPSIGQDPFAETIIFIIFTSSGHVSPSRNVVSSGLHIRIQPRPPDPTPVPCMPYAPMKPDPQPVSATASKPVSAPRTASGTGSGPASEAGFKRRFVPGFSSAVRCLLTGLILSLCTVFQGAAQHTAQNAPNPENLADTAIPRINSTDGPANRLPGGENTAISDGEVSRFGRLLVQTPQGRIEPVDTYASELLRKLHHRDHYGRLTATEWLLGVLADPDRWSREPFIYLPDKNVRTLLAGAQAPRTDGGSPGPGICHGPDIAARRRQIRRTA